ncbi:MAG: sulfite exporter TauE/SafE family protein [Helicobacter sp.]|nr:sulfite exporter TauE/SafE family protein [Helicobacteraceae bacterium]MDY3112866.1 sulfite exporter TauE/SafE family protein [Helicobacter sp.]
MELLAFLEWQMIPLFFIGILTGILAGFFGIGGGAVLVPLVMLLGYDIKIAIGISIMQMIFSSIYGSYVNYKLGLLALKDGIFIGIGGLIGASFSGAVVDFTPSIVLEVAFSCFVIYSLIKLFKAKPQGGECRLSDGIIQKAFLILCGAIIGVFAISLGIGGGIMIAPLLAYYLGYDTKKIVPIALFFVIFSSISGFTSLAFYGYADFKSGILVGIASLIGVRLGIYLLSKANFKAHKNALLIMYIIVLSVMLKKIFLP